MLSFSHERIRPFKLAELLSLPRVVPFGLASFRCSIETAKAGGWLSRAARVLENHPDCVEQGYLLLPTAYRSVSQW